MCDYSLQHAKTRPAVIADKLITKRGGAYTTGFVGINDASTYVCLLPGSELAFDEVPATRGFLNWFKSKHKVAIFRQIRKNEPHTHHDALEFPGGEIVLLTSLAEGRTATVLQLPAAPKTKHEADEQKRLSVTA